MAIMLQITPLPAFTDNYIWLLQRGTFAVAVDPGDAGVVLNYCRQNQLQLCAILITHRHDDHIAGVAALREAFACPVYAPRHPAITSATRIVNKGDTVDLPQLGLRFSVLALPGHTLDHIAYSTPGMLFSGDTLFACGCGRLFDGSAEQLFQSLQKIAALPSDTLIYGTHEYTLSNQRFALTVDPHNLSLQQRCRRDQIKREAGQPTLPTILAEELSDNPFLRCTRPEIRQAVEQYCGRSLGEAAEIFAELRRWKDNFR